jgi:dTDP-4-amino-4,6-dideoxygalactose transaminase
MHEKIPLSDIDMGKEEIDAVTEVLKSKWLSMGPITLEFENKFSNFLGIKHSFGVCNGTAALHIANKVLGIGKGDEVILPSLTFVATSNATLYCGAKPVFADIKSLDNLNISPDDILEKITTKTKAITVVHYGGYPCDMDAIMQIAEDHDLRVIEDAAHAPGAVYKDKMCGTIGDVGCFSFFPNKNMVTGEGGMIVTNNDDLAEKFRTIRSHSMTKLTWDRHKGHAYSYDVVDLGFNYRINEIASAIGQIQLSKLEKNNKKREKLVNEYIKQFKSIENISIPFMDYEGKSSYHLFPLILSGHISRDEIIKELTNMDIQTSVHYPPIHLFSYYQQNLDLKDLSLPKTELVSQQVLSLPLYPNMKEEDFRYVCKSLKDLIH